MTMQAVVTPRQWDQENLADLFVLDQQSPLSFVATTHESNLNGRVFGGQLLGQALAAAQQSNPTLYPATLHCLFLQGALTTQPLEYQVTPLQTGKRFTSVHVCGRQGERRVIDVQVTLQAPVSSFFHMQTEEQLPDPEQLQALDHYEDGAWAKYAKPFVDLRLIEPQRYLRACPDEPGIAYWLKLRAPLPENRLSHAQALAYLSDYWVNSAAISYHVPINQARERLFISSLNHSVWFHQPLVADDWLLFVCESPSLQRGRGLSLARVYDRQRNLVASISQDCLVGERE